MANIISELYAAASLGNIDSLYNVIQQDPHILEEIVAIPFVNTPLHTSALAGHLEFCMEIMRLKPSFGSKLNQQGFSPIHVALQNNQHNVVRRLVKKNKDLVRVKGREGVTPLHFVCQCGDDEDNIRLLIDLLDACPDCIKDVNVRDESALHISLINGNLRAFRILIGWLRNNFRKDAELLECAVFKWKDSSGNTLLHIATLKDNKEAVDLLIMIKMVKINAKNLENQTALDIAEAHDLAIIKRTLLKARAKSGASVDDDTSNREDKLTSNLSLQQYFDIQFERITKQISEEQRNAYMVIGTLLVTAIYQTVLSPPGGLTQDQGGSHNATSTSSRNSTAQGKSVLPVTAFGVVTFLNFSIIGLGINGIMRMSPPLPRRGKLFLAKIPLWFFLASYVVSVLAIMPLQHL
ncbi:hypothetical protein PIB30_091368 [Stylosanthes scabra]|uniref:PGG domain-containing protein n=1 Tax=Stylosanthes scabra TaxID=79078 RepID=A0ABU6RV67_9FABA|nr:hypothetical protein [Stylosanthes scabra]